MGHSKAAWVAPDPALSFAEQGHAIVQRILQTPPWHQGLLSAKPAGRIPGQQVARAGMEAHPARPPDGQFGQARAIRGIEQEDAT